MSFKKLFIIGFVLLGLLIVMDRYQESYALTTDFLDHPKAPDIQELGQILPPPIMEISGEPEIVKQFESTFDLTVSTKGKAGEYEINHCKSIVYKSLLALPAKNLTSLKNLVFSFDSTDRRGLASGKRLKLRCNEVSDNELAAVVVHEFGHIVDLGTWRGTVSAGATEFHDGSYAIYKDDLSLEFYRLSWLDEKTKKTDSDLDFISMYGAEDPFEDLAESVAAYRLQGKYFRQLASINTTLQKKYDFIKENIFVGEEFDLANKNDYKIVDRTYDITVMEYERGKALGSRL